jgi:alpha-1,6-mannosyltransferase
MESQEGPVTRSAVQPARLVGWGCVLAVAMVAIAFLDPGARPWAFLACAAFAGGAYLRVLPLLGRIRGESAAALSFCLALAALWRAPLLVLPPKLSTDVYRYVWDGRVQRLGYDPYVLEPGDPRFRGLHTDETLLMNHTELPTPYPAGAELFFRAVTTLGESARIMKAAIVACDVATVVVLLGWLADSRRSRWWVLAYAWNPLIALEGAGNGHVDLLGALCLVIAARSLGRGRSAIAASALALAIGVKLLPAVVIPLLWRRIRVRDAAIALAVLAALYFPWLRHGTLPTGSLGSYLDLWRFNAPLYAALEWLFPSRFLFAVAAAAGFAVATCARRRLPVDAPEAWALPLATTLAFAPTVYPWYFACLAPFLFAPRVLPLAVWTVASLATYFVFHVLATTGSWSLPAWVMIVEYGAVLGAFVWPMMRDGSSLGRRAPADATLHESRHRRASC